MAACSSGMIRLRLLFDYPPPSTAGCRMCWLLVDRSACRVVSDLESVIREKFGFGRRSIFHLFVEDCYLPHTESIYVVRDNDSVRVKVECAAQMNGLDSGPDTTKRKKRCREEEEDGEEDDGETMKKKRRSKKKRRCKESVSDNAKQAAAEEEKKRMKRKKKMAEKSRGSPEPVTAPKPAAAAPVLPVKVGLPGRNTKKPQPTQKPSSSDSSSSDEDGAPLKTSSTPTASKPVTAPKPAAATPELPVKVGRPGRNTKKPQPTQKPSSSDSSSSDEDGAPLKTSSTPTASKPVTAPKPAAATPELPVKVGRPGRNTKKPQPTQKPSSSDSSSSDEDGAPLKTSSTPSASKPVAAPKPVIAPKPTQKKPISSSSTDSSSDEILPNTRPPGPPHQVPSDGKNQSVNWTQNQSASVGKLPCGKVADPQDPNSEEEIQLVIRHPQQPTRGRGGGRGRRGGQAERDASASGQRGFRSSCDGDQNPSDRTDSLINKSTVLQNGGDGIPKQDYSSLPLLAAPPPVGQKIAFKLLELTENYTPQVSEFKEGKILSFDPTTTQIELELLSNSQAPLEPGKFDLVYQNPDGSERVEYAVSRGCWVTERWDSLLEPRLII